MVARKRWGWGFVPLLVALMLAGFGFGSDAGAHGTPAATPDATAGATPEVPDALVGVDPDELYAALLTAAVPADILPPADALPSVYPWRDTNDEDLDGTLGGAVIATEDPFGTELSPAISYIVFPDDAGAAERFGSLAAIGAEDGVTLVPVESLGYPAATLAFPEQVLCIAQAGNVLVIGSVAPTGDAAADTDTVTAITEVGIVYLLSVAAGVR